MDADKSSGGSGKKARPSGTSVDSLSLGREVVGLFSRITRMLRIHHGSNDAIRTLLDRFARTIARVCDREDSCDLKLFNDQLHLCEVRIPMDVENFISYQGVTESLSDHMIGTVSFERGTGPDDLLGFLSAYLEAARLPDGTDPFPWLDSRLADLGIEKIQIEVLPPEELHRTRSEESDVRGRSISTFFKAVYLTRGLLAEVGPQRIIHVRKAKRLVTSIVDILDLDQSTLLGLTNIKNFDEYTFNHSVNVCILALSVGRRIGLSRRRLGELGLAALFHDLGKTSLSSRLLNKVGALSGEEKSQLRSHPVEGVRQLIRLKGPRSVTTKLMLSVFRHHNNFDGSGYPPLGDSETPSLYSRIIRVVDSYDAMTSKRIYRTGHRNNVEAVEEIWGLSGRHFDPVIVKAFIATVGFYPVGSLVQLQSGEIAVVIKNPFNDEELDRPVVRTLAAWDDRPFTSTTIDLSDDRQRSIYGYFQGSEAESLLPAILLDNPP